ncbi:uncharacterized protein [Dendropsophus ebraccatus]
MISEVWTLGPPTDPDGYKIVPRINEAHHLYMARSRSMLCVDTEHSHSMNWDDLSKKITHCSVRAAKMNNLPLLACLVMFLIHQGHGLSCITCSTQTDPDCSGSSTTCSSQQVCKLQVTYYAGRNILVIFRGCGTSADCNTTFSHLSTERLDSWIFCCKEDNCNLTLPDWKTLSNGFQCPFLKFSSTEPAQVLECKGDENRCYNSTQVYGSGYTESELGCANDYFCAYASPGVQVKTCQNATASPTTTTTTTTTIPTTTATTTTIPTTTTPTTTTTIPTTTTTILTTTTPTITTTIPTTTATTLTTTTTTTTIPTTTTSTIPTTTATTTVISTYTTTSTAKTTIQSSSNSLYSQGLLILFGLFSVYTSR